MRGEFRRLMERLEQLLPIVSTVRAQDIGEMPEQVRKNYEFVASVFYAMESVKDLRGAMLRRLTNDKTFETAFVGEIGCILEEVGKLCGTEKAQPTLRQQIFNDAPCLVNGNPLPLCYLTCQLIHCPTSVTVVKFFGILHQIRLLLF